MYSRDVDWWETRDDFVNSGEAAHQAELERRCDEASSDCEGEDMTEEDRLLEALADAELSMEAELNEIIIGGPQGYCSPEEDKAWHETQRENLGW